MANVLGSKRTRSLEEITEMMQDLTVWKATNIGRFFHRESHRRIAAERACQRR